MGRLIIITLLSFFSIQTLDAKSYCATDSVMIELPLIFINLEGLDSLLSIVVHDIDEYEQKTKEEYPYIHVTFLQLTSKGNAYIAVSAVNRFSIKSSASWAGYFPYKNRLFFFLKGKGEKFITRYVPPQNGIFYFDTSLSPFAYYSLTWHFSIQNGCVSKRYFTNNE